MEALLWSGQESKLTQEVTVVSRLQANAGRAPFQMPRPLRGPWADIHGCPRAQRTILGILPGPSFSSFPVYPSHSLTQKLTLLL